MESCQVVPSWRFRGFGTRKSRSPNVYIVYYPYLRVQFFCFFFNPALALDLWRERRSRVRRRSPRGAEGMYACGEEVPARQESRRRCCPGRPDGDGRAVRRVCFGAALHGLAIRGDSKPRHLRKSAPSRGCFRTNAGRGSPPGPSATGCRPWPGRKARSPKACAPASDRDALPRRYGRSRDRGQLEASGRDGAHPHSAVVETTEKPATAA